MRLSPAGLKQALVKVHRAKKTLHEAGKDANAPRLAHQSVLLPSNVLMILNVNVRAFNPPGKSNFLHKNVPFTSRSCFSVDINVLLCGFKIHFPYTLTQK